MMACTASPGPGGRRARTASSSAGMHCVSHSTLQEQLPVLFYKSKSTNCKAATGVSRDVHVVGAAGCACMRRFCMVPIPGHSHVSEKVLAKPEKVSRNQR